MIWTIAENEFPASQLLYLMVSQVWQVTILSVVVAWITKTFLRERPFWSYQLWLLVLLKSLTPPVWSSQCGVFSVLFHRMSAATVWLVEHGLGQAVGPNALAAFLASIWLIGALATLAHLLLKWYRIQRRILDSRQSPSRELRASMERLIDRLGVCKAVKFVLTRETLGPMVIGARKPMIVLPARLVESSSIAQLEPILAHELLHVKRRDTWVALLETIVRCIWWFHPSVQRAADAASHVLELCCDDDVLHRLRCPPRLYADGLLRVIESKCGLQPRFASAGIRSDQVVSARLERIMNWHQKPREPRTRLLFAVLAMLAILPGRPL